ADWVARDGRVRTLIRRHLWRPIGLGAGCLTWVARVCVRHAVAWRHLWRPIRIGHANGVTWPRGGGEASRHLVGGERAEQTQQIGDALHATHTPVGRESLHLQLEARHD